MDNAIAIGLDDARRKGGLDGWEREPMSDKNYDVLILGGGNAGMGVTAPTRAAVVRRGSVDSNGWRARPIVKRDPHHY